MPVEDFISVLSRWFHIAFAIIAIGGAFFLRCILHPALQQMEDTNRETLLKQIQNRWRKYVHFAIFFLLLSGSYNIWYGIFIVKKVVLYHMLFGVKLLAAIAIFIIASGLVGRSSAFAALRARSSRWLTVILVLGGLIVVISGIMKYLPSQPVGLATASAWIISPLG